MFSRYWRPAAIIIVLTATIAAAVNFFVTHPGVGNQLQQTDPVVLISLLILYLLFMGTLWLVFQASLVMCNAKLPASETVLVTAYSSIINFFGPLQSGPAFRAAYLKKKHGISLKNYTLASLVNYLFYALFSGLLLLSGYFGWWLVVPVAIVAFTLLAATKFSLPLFGVLKKLTSRGLVFMAIAVLLQVAIFAVIFYVELHAVDASVTFAQALIYTGAANFALFVSITPGAIGFRESFVLFTQNLHHIDTTTIVAASLIDRGVYVVMLLLLVAIIFGTHAHKKIQTLRK